MRTSPEPSTYRNRWSQFSVGSTLSPLVMVLLLWTQPGFAQNNLGQLLDAGGKLLSFEEFRQQVAQHIVVGPTAAGGNLEIMYASSGAIQGVGSLPFNSKGLLNGMSPYDGAWTSGENETVCATMNIRAAGGGVATTLPRRCQFWFKLGERYYLSDSDTDRSAKVLVRTIKP